MPVITGGTDAGSSLIPYYRIAERAFPLLPDDVIIHPDTEPHTFGIAWYRGIDPVTGFPIFAGRDDLVASPLVEKTPYVGFHEAGHAFQTVVARSLAERQGVSFHEAINAGRASYWAMRGFPGTWWDANTRADSPAGGWRYYPDESFADAFAQVVFGYSVGEWTENYGLPIDVATARAFFKQLESEATGGHDVDEATTRTIARQEATDILAMYALEARETGFDPIKKAYDPLLKHKHGIDGTITTTPVTE